MRIVLLCLLAYQSLAASIPSELNDANFADGLNAFSLDFLKQLEPDKKNVIFSPLGMSMALGMLLKGAQNKPREDLFNLLHFSKYSNKDKIHNKFKALLEEYKSMNTRENEPRNATIELANMMLTASSYNLPKTFADAVRRDYEASVGKENFATEGPQVMGKINKFVNERTHGLIPAILTSPLSSDTIFVLINTIFFKGYWTKPFNKYTTKNDTFYNADKTEVTAELMTKYSSLMKYYHSSKLNAAMLEMPYNGEVSMIVVLPDEKHGLPQLLQNLTLNEMNELIGSLTTEAVNIHFPKFKFEMKTDIREVLLKMNLNLQSVLTTLDPILVLSAALHKAKIEVHEAGTEAAAVTLLTTVPLIGHIGPRPTPKEFKADHPFVFCIRDMKSNINLFCGTVNKLN